MFTRPFGSMVYSKRPRKIMVARYPPFPTITHSLAILSGLAGVSRVFDPLKEKNPPRGCKNRKRGLSGSASPHERDKASEEAVSRVLCAATKRVAAGRPFLYGGRFRPP